MNLQHCIDYSKTKYPFLIIPHTHTHTPTHAHTLLLSLTRLESTSFMLLYFVAVFSHERTDLAVQHFRYLLHFLFLSPPYFTYYPTLSHFFSFSIILDRVKRRVNKSYQSGRRDLEPFHGFHDLNLTVYIILTQEFLFL